MRYSNFHTHCYYCDGEGSPEDYVQKAIEKGFEALGFTSHAPVHYPCSWAMKKESLYNYCGTINNLKEKYKGKIEIYLGLEIDYFSSEYGPSSPVFKELNLDYTIGSVHLIRDGDSKVYLEVDGAEDKYIQLIKNGYHGDAVKFVGDYYGLIRNMVMEHNPDIIGHIDLIRKNNKGNKYFSTDEGWYRDEVLKTLDVILKSGSILEVNTGGLSRKYIDTVYPEPWILKECSRLQIPVVLNSDAHSPSNIDAYYEYALSVIRDAGYSKLSVLNNGVWTQNDTL